MNVFMLKIFEVLLVISFFNRNAVDFTIWFFICFYGEYDFKQNLIKNTRGAKDFEIYEWVINRIIYMVGLITSTRENNYRSKNSTRTSVKKEE